MLQEYPKAISRRNGCKVGWLTYDNEVDAITASQIARSNASYLSSQGYEYGYCVPGQIKLYGSTWEVTIP